MTAINFKSVSKKYEINKISSGYLFRDLQSYIARLTNKEDPNSKIKVNKNNDNTNFLAINNLSFSVEKGEVIGIIGKNGAGKSTLLKLLSRVTLPSEGEIEVNGKIASLLEVGTGFHPDLSGRENIFLNGAILGMKKIEIIEKFDEIVEFAGVSKFIDMPVKRYSSGMYVRLAFSVAAHLEPDILIIDEVLAVGDLEFQKKCINKMRSVSKNTGRTILFVSHNMVAISSLCKKVLYLDSGTKKFIGNVNDGITLYLNDNQSTEDNSLTKRKDRVGEGCLLFVDTWTEDQKEIRKNLFLSGDEINIIAIFDVKNNINYNKCTFAFQLQDQNDYVITDFNTKSYLLDFPIPIVRGRVECKIKRNPFMPGVYSYHLIARTDGIVQDFITYAGKFSIEAGDFFQTGSIFDTGHGTILLEHEWKLFKE